MDKALDTGGHPLFKDSFIKEVKSPWIKPSSITSTL